MGFNLAFKGLIVFYQVDTLDGNEQELVRFSCGKCQVKTFLVEIQIRDNSVRGLLSDEATRVLPGVCRGGSGYILS